MFIQGFFSYCSQKKALKHTCIIPHLVEIFPSKKCLVVGIVLEQSGESVRFLALLPGFAAAVSV